MGGVTTAMPDTFKAELPQVAHCFNATVTPTGNVTNTSQTITSMSSVAGITAGAPISGTGIPAGTVVASIDSTTQITISKPATATNTGVTLTISGDSFMIALIKVSPTGTYDHTTTNYTDLTGNSDEVSGTGYTTGGQALANNITPAKTTTQTFWQWSSNPSWTSATISTIGCIIYNLAARLAGVVKRAAYVGSFGGTQTVTSGTLTLLQPTNGAGTSLLQLN